MAMQQRITQVVQRIASEFVAIRAEMGGQKIVKVTMAQYTALVAKDANTLYFLDE